MLIGERTLGLLSRTGVLVTPGDDRDGAMVACPDDEDGGADRTAEDREGESEEANVRDGAV